MNWRIGSLKPGRKQYEKFEEELSKKSSPGVFESGLLTFLTVLLLMPLTLVVFD